MDLDRETVWQIVATFVVVGLFIAALAVMSQMFVTDVAVENEATSGTLDGEIENLQVEDGSVSGSFTGDLDGTFEGNLTKDFTAEVSGEIEGTTSDGTVEGTMDGSITGPLEGDITGEINGTVDEETNTFSGEFSGTVEGSTEKISPDGGVALVALIALFIVVMPTAGYLIHSHEFEE